MITRDMIQVMRQEWRRLRALEQELALMRAEKLIAGYPLEPYIPPGVSRL